MNRRGFLAMAAAAVAAPAGASSVAGRLAVEELTLGDIAAAFAAGRLNRTR